MSIPWGDVHVGFNKRTGKLFIGNGKVGKDGNIRFESKSGDKTTEIILSVVGMMRFLLQKRTDDRPYVGYDIDASGKQGLGKLIYIKPGYDFTVHRKKKVTQNNS